MSLFTEMSQMGHEQVVYCRNEAVGLRAIIAIHNTTLGPALAAWKQRTGSSRVPIALGSRSIWRT